MTSAPFPGLGRRLLAILYDTVLLAGMLVVAALPWTLLPDTSHTAPEAHRWWRLGFQLYLLAIIFVFFGWFWTHGGQTLGMRAWRLRLIDAASGEDIGRRRAGVRFAGAIVSAAALGMGYAWVIVDRERCSWHDRWSGSRLILLPKDAGKSRTATVPATGQPTRRNM